MCDVDSPEKLLSSFVCVYVCCSCFRPRFGCSLIRIFAVLLMQVKLEPILNIPAEQQQLSLAGATLVDQNTLETYNINSQSTIQITT